MKIAICTNFYLPMIGGGEIVASTIADYLAKDHELFVFTRRIKGRDHTKYPYKIFEYHPSDVVPFFSALQKVQPDLVFVYSDLFDFFRQLITLRSKFRLIVALCGANWLHSHPNYIRKLNRGLHNIERLVCHSTVDRDYRLCSVEPLRSKTSVIPNGVNVEEFDDNLVSRNDLLSDHVSKRWLLNVSNFFPGKGQEHLADILRLYPHPEDLVYIQACNDIPFPVGAVLEHKWRKKVKLLTDKGMVVKLMKNLDREKIVGLFKQSNVLAFTTEKEVAPLVLLEAMAAELPWVSADVGNASELKGGKCVNAVKNYQFHSVFDDRVRSLFMKSIEEVLSKPNISREGRNQINESLNWTSILPLYKEIIEI